MSHEYPITLSILEVPRRSEYASFEERYEHHKALSTPVSNSNSPIYLRVCQLHAGQPHELYVTFKRYAFNY